MEKEKEQCPQIEIAGKRYSNITVINKDREPVAVIAADELITKKGYKILFDVGEGN
ncbi:MULTISPECIES: hypothetical protein [Lactobacillaceae]|uniref:Uncharacterized protein n=1 Tax=Levilactobacillus namurensis TaxID=380393 RepID=A0AAW8W9H1_9LACO|nr:MULTISPECIES: hypothetical protein [Lactobacillaceae]MBS1006802.1 hypothetical protein [Levilactobacillus brevis]MBU7558896.1 hypothetical protein [Levilactobacillus brevis]MCE6010505.1 hypothetical protein [Levilactobacillus brevis]MCE6025066.1 hypothetical protein [Levilactobacillus brevis]MCE6033457.1 hypothetical protein [Levilactobacillus brevis]